MAEDRGFSDLISTASSLLNSQGQGHSSKPSQGSHASAGGISKPQSSSSPHAHKPSYGEVYASAQVVMDAAKNKLHKADSSSAADDIDYGKLAGAAGTLISAASHYGKLEESGAGKYAQKAQEYLQAYEMKHNKPGTTPYPSQPAASTGHGHGQGHAPSSYAPAATNPSKPSSTSQDYPTAYPPQGYPDAQQGYGYTSQGQSKPAGSQAYVDSYPPAGYPPAGYPSSGTNYNPPAGYPSSGGNYNAPAGYPSSGGNHNPPAGYPSSGTNYSRPSKYS